MKIIDKYIFFSILKSSFFNIVNLSLIILATQSIKYLDLMVNNGMNIKEFIFLSILLLPSLIFIVTPFCLFAAVIYSLNRFVSAREIIVLKNSSLNNLEISRPVLKVVFLVFILHYFIAIYLMPIVNHKFKLFVNNLRENFVAFVIQEGVFTNPTLDQTFYCEKKLSNNHFINIFFQKQQNESNFKVYAKEGKLFEKDGELFLKLIDGNRQSIEKDGELSTLFFNESIIKIDFNKKNSTTRLKSLQELSLANLLFPEFQINEETRFNMLAEAINRITWPLFDIILGYLACISLICCKYSRSGYFENILKYSTLAIIFIMINFLINSLSFKKPLFHLVQIIFILSCTLICNQKLKSEEL